ncbi:MAG TPA: OsmC family protein, partial [Gallionella sp.]|nr:OsmC family protein [Gallionella sp.]
MKARVKWVEQVSFLGETESNHAVLMDGAPTAGGRNLGPRPMELLLIGTGGCTSFDVISILKKSRQAVSDCHVELNAERAETDPKVFTKIHMHFVVKGKGIKPEVVEKAI